MKWSLFIVALCLGIAHNGSAASISPAAAQTVERNLFAADIYGAIAADKLNENVVISPAAIQTSMALAYTGAKGKTADEMQTGLRLGDDVARQFSEFQQTFTQNNNIRLANNIYINENLEFKGNFQQAAQRNFESNLEKADFHPPYNRRTADRLNGIIETKTNGQVKNVIDGQQLNDRTEGIILNAIAFSGAPWQKAFKEDKTSSRSFGSSGRMDTMWTVNNFKYGEFSELDAKVIELPYQNSAFSMLIILPNNANGLSGLVQKLANKNLVSLVNRGLNTEKLEVYLPKFSVAFGTSLIEPFKKLGVTTMFTRDGDFGNLYRMFVRHYINIANHKAYVAVSEAGAEPSLESGGLIKSFFTSHKKFEVNHPFVFVIKNGESIIFMGHIVNNAITN